jgi:outer membrane protein insertion porin family
MVKREPLQQHSRKNYQKFKSIRVQCSHDVHIGACAAVLSVPLPNTTSGLPMKSHFFSGLKQLLSVILLSSSLFVSVFAVEPFDIQDIRLEGLQRVEPGNVLATLPFKVGESYSDDKGTLAIRNLFALGLFKDVRIELKGNVVIVVVEERPLISAVNFVGIKEFDKDTLKKALKDIGLSEGRPFDKALSDRAEQELKRQYINKSLYGAEVVTTVAPAERNKVNLNFTVIEGEVSKIKEFKIVGNKAFDQSTIKDQLDLSEPNYMSWYTKSDRYSQAKLNADLENIRSFYLSRGYLEFRVDSTQVAISPNKQDINITINITEGAQFVVSSVELEGYYLGRDNEFKSLISIKPGRTYNITDIVETTKAFSEYFGNFGFAFARIEPRSEIDRQTNRVKIILQADPSRRAYVRRINISGNDRTKDEIIRREFRQMESAWYDGDKIRKSRDRIDRLGYFTEVTVDTQEVPGTPDQIDINLKVAEKPTGALQLGAGFSSSERFFLSFGISQDNFFGTGNSVGIQVNTSKYNKLYQINTTDPYFTEDGVSRTLNFYDRNLRPYAATTDYYNIYSTGLGVSFGVPIAEVDTVHIGIAYDKTSVSNGSGIPVAYTASGYVGKDVTSVPITVGWARDSRDSMLAPNKGKLIRLNSELGAFGDLHYYKNSGQYQQYWPLTRKYTLAVNAELGIGGGYNGEDFPVFKNYYAGGLGSVRGFLQNSLQTDTTYSRFGGEYSTGGAKKILLNTEFLMPFPGVGTDKTLRLFTFVDVGNVYTDQEAIDVAQLRSSAGLGLSWISPVGPLRFAFAKPIKKFDNDRMQTFQFQIGTAF